MDMLGDFFFRVRNILFPVVFLFCLIIGSPRSSPVLDILGLLIAGLGQALRMLTIGYEYIERGGRDRKVHASRLVQGGVFAHLRNPLYLGNLLIALGLALLINATAFYLIFMPFILFAYGAIIRAEERFLLQKFGDEYKEYCLRVRRWIPKTGGFERTRAGMRFNWTRVLLKEYNTTFTLLAALAGLHIWSAYRIRGSDAFPPLAPAVAIIAAWAALYLGVRFLKKTGRISLSG
jgi:protein-S-isoprenylcysteine O-methyltransferase Ste14